MMARARLPSPELLRQLLTYDPETGRLTWRPRTVSTVSELGGTDVSVKIWNSKYAGALADSTISQNGYRVVCVYDRRMSAHRVAWAVHFGEWPKDEIDHLNHIRADNRLINLRDVSRTVNARNQSLRSDNKSGQVGIWEKKPKAWGSRWSVVIAEGSRIKSQKSFKCLGQAVRFRNDSYRERGFSPAHGTKALREWKPIGDLARRLVEKAVQRE